MRLIGAVLIDKDSEAQGRAFISEASLDKLYDEKERKKALNRAEFYQMPIPEDIIERSKNLLQAQLEQLKAA